MKSPFVITTYLSKEYGGTSLIQVKNKIELMTEIFRILREDNINNNLIEIKIESVDLQEDYEYETANTL